MAVETNVIAGMVKWFNGVKGYGFIAQNNGGVDLLFHFKDVQGTGCKRLKEGQKVSCKAVGSQKGLHAEEVNVI